MESQPIASTGGGHPRSARDHARVAVLPGDGIGPEVTAAAAAVLQRVAAAHGLTLELEQRPVGGAAIESEGAPLPEATLRLCRESDAVLFGAAGGPRWDHLRGDARPGAATLRLRRELGLCVNLRPVRAFPALCDRSPLRREVIRGADFVIVRELTGGAYFGEHARSGSGMDESAHDTMVYTRREVARVVGFACRLARSRRGRLTSVYKANALWSGRLWRDVATEVAAQHPDVSVEHALVDSFALGMLQDPGRLDVVVAENLFGDILSDEAAVITGSLGLMASASLNPEGGPALYEPIHGSAPGIAGRGIADPMGAILSAALMLEHSLGLPQAAREVRQAVDRALEAGALTPDLGGTATTEEMTAAVLRALPARAAAGAGS